MACLVSNLNPFAENVVKADQPVHCLREQLYGNWQFYVSNESATVNLFDTKEVCTHSIPNKVQIVSEKHGFNFGKNQSLYNVNLMQDYKAEAVFCKKEGSCDKTIVHGKWTNIYDQAFDVELDNGLRFIANLRYNMKKKLSPDPVAQA